jgi:EpsI family protein
MMLRAAIVSLCMLGGAAYLAATSRPEQVPARQPFIEFPRRIAQWSGREALPFTPDILAVLGADEYVNRIYTSDKGALALYIGYYQSQRQGDTIHSPLNCLPGAGWLPVSKEHTRIPLTDPEHPTATEIRVNRIVIQKGLEKQLVLYWYQSHGRAEPNEYWSKAYMIYDAVRLNRTDAALVRVVSPIGPDDADASAATERATDFVQAMFPSLVMYLPL